MVPLWQERTLADVQPIFCRESYNNPLVQSGISEDEIITYAEKSCEEMEYIALSLTLKYTSFGSPKQSRRIMSEKLHAGNKYGSHVICLFWSAILLWLDLSRCRIISPALE